MITLGKLRGFARAVRAELLSEAGISQFEIYGSSTEQSVIRINYTSEIPSRGLEECKSLAADGFALRIVDRKDPHAAGIAFSPGELNLDALRTALECARQNLIVDSYFSGLPTEPKRLKAAPAKPNGLMRTSDATLVKLGWRIVRSAVEAYASAPANGSRSLVVGGDLALTRDRIVIASSNFDDLRSDESAHFASSITVLLESPDAKGTASAVGSSTAELLARVPDLGRQAARRAVAMDAGERPGAGTYRVVFGPQPIAEILCYLVLPSLTTGAFYASSSAFHGRFGDRVIDSRLDFYDEPTKGALRRVITCEGIPVRRTTLIKAGRLAGLMSDYYDTHRLAVDERRHEKLGPRYSDSVRFAPVNGYRLGEGGGRRFDATPGSSGTNVMMRARAGVSEQELLRKTGNGIYVGRIWYTYPINGQRAGDFTCTVSGDSYLIRDGRIAAPLAPNCLRINANLKEVFGRPLAISRRSHPALVWGSPEVYYAPTILAGGIQCAPVGEAGD